jgi:hypothetical protein
MLIKPPQIVFGQIAMSGNKERREGEKVNNSFRGNPKTLILLSALSLETHAYSAELVTLDS